MKIKKLSLEIDESKLEKGILEEINSQIKELEATLNSTNEFRRTIEDYEYHEFRGNWHADYGGMKHTEYTNKK